MGKLNITKHKSWNVYSAKNIERVKRDEENARELELRKQRTDSEERIEILRSRKKRTVRERSPKLVSETKSAVPWYAAPQKKSDSTQEKDALIKSRDDPLASFSKKCRITKRDEQVPRSVRRSNARLMNPSLSELQIERLSREKRERRRQEELLRDIK